MVKLVLLPGMDGTGELFAPFLAALGSELDVTVVRYSTDKPLDYLELKLFVREALPSVGSYVLLGESFSGPIAISLAASQPPGLCGLVLCCTFAQNPRPFFNGLHSFVGWLPAIAPPVSLLSKFLLGRFSTAALRTALARALAQVSPAVMRARLQAVLSVDVSARVGDIRVPILYLRALQDHVVPQSSLQLISKFQPSVRVVEIRAPHFLLQAAPIEAVGAVQQFMREVCPLIPHPSGSPSTAS